MQKTMPIDPDKLLNHAVVHWLHVYWPLAVIVGSMAVIEQAWQQSRRQRRRYQ
jgi:hypothetical protein